MPRWYPAACWPCCALGSAPPRRTSPALQLHLTSGPQAHSYSMVSAISTAASPPLPRKPRRISIRACGFCGPSIMSKSSRSFARAAQLDPTCAMCFWGVALTVGPNYNLPMTAEPRAKMAWNALQQAQANAPHTTPIEQALIAALVARYPNSTPRDPSNEGPVLTTYAKAMQGVAQAFPDDSDVQTLTAEALMNVNAWKLWALDGAATPGPDEIVARLEGVLAKDPQHPGANHYYIHAVEASPHPEKAVPSAERLAGMMPAAGHLDHMPAHIMQRVGRYADAAEANRKGAAADLAYFAQTKPPDYYAMCIAHNYQFLAFSTAMQGRKADTIDATRKARAVISDDLLMAMPGSDWYFAETYATLIRFGMWDEMLAEAPPSAALTALTAGYHYGRVVALAAKGRTEDARAELTGLEKIAAAVTADDSAGLNAAARARARRPGRQGANRRRAAAQHRCHCPADRGFGKRGQPGVRRTIRLVLSRPPYARRRAAAGRQCPGGRRCVP